MDPKFLPPYLVLVLDANGEMVLNVLTNEYKLQETCEVEGPVWKDESDWVENPLGMMMRSAPILQLTMIPLKR